MIRGVEIEEDSERESRGKESENDETERKRERTERKDSPPPLYRLCREAGRGCVPRIRAFIHLRHDILKIRARGRRACTTTPGSRSFPQTRNYM